MRRVAGERLDDVAEHRLGVAEQHQRVVAVVELVVDAGKARVHRALVRDDELGLVGVDDRHAVDRALVVVPRRRIDDVVGADDEHDVGLRQVAVDLVHLDQRVVRDFGFGQQHVHVAGHAPGDGMDGELHVDAALGQLIVELADPVLRLRHRHAVAGDDDDAVGVLEQVGGVLRRAALDASSPRRPPPRLHLPERAEEHVGERPVHRRHMMTERIRPDDPSSAPAMMSSLFSSTKPIATADRPAYEFSSEMTVGMSAPPIGMISSTPNTQRQHDDDAETAASSSGLNDAASAPPPTAIASSAEVDEVLVAVGDRPRRHDLLQLARGHQAAGERQVPEDHLEDDRRHAERRQLRRAAARCMYLAVPTRPAARPPNACDSAVRCGTAVSGTRDSGMPIADADDQRDDDPLVVDDLGREQRADDRGAPCRRRPAATPRRAVFGMFSQRSDRMKSAAAAR